MANLTFYYGTMAVGKTTKLLQDYYNYSKYLINICVMKPLIDTKGDKCIINRQGESISVDILISKSASLLNKKYLNKFRYARFILVDEAQFLNKRQINELWYIAHKFDISVICYGLKNNFKGDLFEGSMQLFSRSDELHELTVNCVCGNVAKFNARLINDKYLLEGDEIIIDGAETSVEYIPLCAQHYLEYVINNEFV